MNDWPSVVYIIDDDPSVRRALRRLLAAHGFRVEVFDSAETFFAHDITPNSSCILADVHMPGMGSEAIFGVLKGRGIRIPIVYLSASVRPDHPLVRAGQSVLPKPVDAADLLACIDALAPDGDS